MVSFYLLTPLDKIVANAHRFRCLSLNVRDGQLWRRRVGGGGGAIFEPHEFFSCYYFPCMNFFVRVHEYSLGLLGVREFFFICASPAHTPNKFPNGLSLIPVFF